MKEKEQILIRDTTGKLHIFVVTERHIYKYDSFPVDVAFGPADRAEIQLLSCDGEYNHTLHNTSDRIVISAVTN